MWWHTRKKKTDFVFRRNVLVHLNRRGLQFIRLLAADVCASAIVVLDTPCSEVVWRVLATHSIRQFPIDFPSRASPCAITFQLDSANYTTAWMTVEYGFDSRQEHETVLLWISSRVPPCLLSSDLSNAFLHPFRPSEHLSCRGYERVELFVYFPIRLHSVVHV